MCDKITYGRTPKLELLVCTCPRCGQAIQDVVVRTHWDRVEGHEDPSQWTFRMNGFTEPVAVPCGCTLGVGEDVRVVE